MRRTLGMLALSLVAAFSTVAVPGIASAAAAATAAPDLAATNVGWLNSLRVSAGLSTLQQQGWAQEVAQAHSLDMAIQDNLFHNMTGYMDLGRTAMGASYLGENVGMGSSLDYTQSLLLASPLHMANILNPRFNYVGVAAAVDTSGEVWLTEDFAQIAGPSAPAPPAAMTKALTPAKALSPATAPAPAARPAASRPAVVAPRPAADGAKPAARAAGSPVASPAAGRTAATSPLAPVRTEALRLSGGAAPTGRMATILYAALVAVGFTFPLGLGYAISRRLGVRAR